MMGVKRRIIVLLVLTALAVALLPVEGNRGSVKISVPDQIKEGENFTITLEISHSNNNEGHYIEWVRLHADDVLIKGWTYDRSSFVPDTVWTLTYTTSIQEETVIKAKANCNLHGGGTTTMTLNIGQVVVDDESAGLPLPILIVILVVVLIGLGLVVLRRR